jgi:squalene synthase HpnC
VTAIAREPEPLGVPAPAAVLARARTENFPVASLLLGRRERAHLLAIYGFARLVDELGDAHPGERLEALEWLEGELDAAFSGSARHPLLVTLQGTIARCHLSAVPFRRLVEANRVDQRVSRYPTWEQLRDYCALSADPVGQLVLEVFGVATPARMALSDSICTALQLVEHCQDVAEDLQAGRVYLPVEDMERFGCEIDDLHEPHAGPAVRGVIAFEVARAHRLLDDGMPLIGELEGRARLGVAAFVAGGRAALQAISRAGYDVLAGPPRASRARRALVFVRTLSRRPAGRGQSCGGWA